MSGSISTQRAHIQRGAGLLLIVCLLLTAASPIFAQELSLTAKLRSLAHVASEGVEAAEAGDLTAMQHEYNEAHELWKSFEDEVSAQNPNGYVAVEGALDVVKDALQAQPVDAAQTKAAFGHLADEATEWSGLLEGSAPTNAPIAELSPALFAEKVASVSAALARNDSGAAQQSLTEAIQIWPAVEGAVATKSQDAYRAIEVELGRAAAALKATPADLPAASAAVERLGVEMQPFATSQSYTWLDAAAIILREGMETLLVLMALLAFLKRSDAQEKQVWIWGGTAVGLLASVAIAFVLQAIFSRAAAGQNREVIEGVTGIVAAGMLFYVSYWLHGKSNLKAWNGYINQRTGHALATGSLFGLGLLAFLAVFREGAETVIFYLGMAPSIAPSELALGLAVGAGVLVVAAVLMHFVGMKLPLRPFFFVASLLVYYLGFKFLGSGIHALQVAGMLPQSPVALLPALPSIGFYATWETLAPQVLLLLAALWLLFGFSRMGTGKPVNNASA